MTKVVSTSLIFIVLFAASPHLKGQNPQDAAAAAAQSASEEAVRRQERMIRLRSTLQDAQALRQKGDLVAASHKFDEAYELVQSVGVGIEPEKKETIEGLDAVRLELARQAQSRGELSEADVQVTRVLRVDPKNEEAQKLKVDN